MSSKTSAIEQIDMVMRELRHSVGGASTPERMRIQRLTNALFDVRRTIEHLPIADTKVCCTIDKSVYSDPHIPETERIKHIKKVCGENIGYEIMKNNFFIVREDKHTNRVIVEVKVLGGK